MGRPTVMALDSSDARAKRMLYLEVNDKDRVGDTFSEMSEFIEANIQPLPEGGMLTTDILIRTPAGVTYPGISIKGDWARWAYGIRAFATSRGLRTGEVNAQAFVSSDGGAYPLELCGADGLRL